MVGATPSPTDGPVVVRHEERLRAGVEKVPTERIRVRKVIVTEQRTITVDVRREEIHVTREPLEGVAGAEATSSATNTPLVIVRHEEQIEVVTTVVPVERVTVGVTSVAEQREVTAQLAHEEIAVDEGAIGDDLITGR